jgi:inner membrane protein
MELWAIWLIAAGMLLIAEMMTLTFYLLWIGIGAAVAAVIALIVPESLIWQVLAGCLTVIVLTIFTKPITRRFRSGESYKDTALELVGKTGYTLGAIEPGKPGLVKVGSETWSAHAEEPLPEGERIVVIARGSTYVLVQKAEGGD